MSDQTYGDVFLQNEQEMSAYNFEYANTDWLLTAFDEAENRVRNCWIPDCHCLHMSKF